ncbi:MAG: mucoidy inhibitor MuiA family protein [Planctomycetes bacterium]|nr:mucoidy inhibitor MuiA family protein [Planctomycetota bacterium]
MGSVACRVRPRAARILGLGLAARGLAIGAAMCAVAVTGFAGEAPETPGKIEAVTVYLGQALVTRRVETTGAAGLSELVVTNLPANVVPGSVYAEAEPGVEVRSVRFRERPVPQDVREEVRKLDSQMQQLADNLQANAGRRALITERRAYLAKLEAFVAPTANTELTHGVLNAETLKTLTEFLFERRTELADEEMTSAIEARTIREQMELVRRQRVELAGASERTAREAVVFVNQAAAGKSAVRVRYLVTNASWSPSYIARLTGDREKFTLEYHASVSQTSGEDWTDVTLTLSTATPSLAARGPALSPLTLSVTREGPAPEVAQQMGEFGKQSYREALGKLKEQRKAAEGQFNLQMNAPNRAATPAGEAAAQQVMDQGQAQVEFADSALNDIANRMQVLDLLSSDVRAKKTGGPRRPRDESGVSVTYELPGRTSMPSRADQQMIPIAMTTLDAALVRVATPVLTNFVYEEATAANTTSTVFLAGPVSTYVDGQFVGRGDIPTVSAGESFTVGLGIDSSLRATRELVEKSETTQGGNRVVTFTYQLTIENFGADPAEVRLLDRLPYTKESEMKVTLLAPGRDLSKDPAYEKRDRKKGVLRWEVTAPAQAVGVTAFTVEYQFRLEYDKQFNVAPAAPSPQAPARAAAWDEED